MAVGKSGLTGILFLEIWKEHYRDINWIARSIIKHGRFFWGGHFLSSAVLSCGLSKRESWSADKKKWSECAKRSRSMRERKSYLCAHFWRPPSSGRIQLLGCEMLLKDLVTYTSLCLQLPEVLPRPASVSASSATHSFIHSANNSRPLLRVKYSYRTWKKEQ